MHGISSDDFVVTNNSLFCEEICRNNDCSLHSNNLLVRSNAKETLNIIIIPLKNLLCCHR